jgi:hypothetical protein
MKVDEMVRADRIYNIASLTHLQFMVLLLWPSAFTLAKVRTLLVAVDGFLDQVWEKGEEMRE